MAAAALPLSLLGLLLALAALAALHYKRMLPPGFYRCRRTTETRPGEPFLFIGAAYSD